jgi:hypothetical protein
MGLSTSKIDFMCCNLLPKHEINTPQFYNRHFMQQMAHQLSLIKLMQLMEETEKVR